MEFLQLSFWKYFTNSRCISFLIDLCYVRELFVDSLYFFIQIKCSYSDVYNLDQDSKT